jgi:type I restriction-modification system DNA methylase subunit
MDQLTFQMSDALNILDFEYENEQKSSVYFVSKLSEYLVSDKYSPYILVELEEAQKFEADAVYFRFLDNGQPPMPQIYIYDNVTHPRDDSDYAKIHRNIWSASEIPLYFVLDRHQIRVFDSRRPVTICTDKSLEISPVRQISLTELNEAIHLYQAEQFSSGFFWEGEEAANNYLASNSINEKLLSSLKVVRTKLKSRLNLNTTLIDHILVICILIKYLEENGIDNEGNNLAQDFFRSSVQAESLVEAIQNGKFIELLDALANHFNGGVFKISDDDKNSIQSTDLSFLASFLSGKIDGEQLVIWEEYSFKYIPIELISNFYEEFLPIDEQTKKKLDSSAIYTPNYLVKLLVDECIPLRGTYKSTIDVSCGSGIFLVTAFRRLAQMWRYQHRTDGKLANINETELQKLLREYIFGVDINPTAVELTIFSLNLALCSMLSPQQIWTRLKFEDLNSKNILTKDFFDFVVTSEKKYDLVIGNPPFKEYKKTDFDNIVDLLKTNNMEFGCEIARYQSSLMFLDRAMPLLKKDGRLCLILPTGPFLHSSQQDKYRTYFFKRYNVTQIIDFTFLKTLLFKGANIATIALFADNREPDDKDIIHIVAKRTGASKEGTFFEFDTYDFFDVPKHLARSDKRVWKCNLLGGSMVYEIVNKYSKSQTIKDYLEQKKKMNGWFYGEGYIKGNKKHKADYITGQQYIVDKSFKDDGEWQVSIENSKGFEGPRDKELYQPPHLIIKRSIGKHRFPMRLSHDYITFREGILGIHCPQESIVELNELQNFIISNNDWLRLMIIACSSRAGGTKSVHTHYSEDFWALPYNPDIRLTDNEKIIVSDALTYILPYFDSTKAPVADEIADFDVLQDFGTLYCQRLNVIYEKNGKKYVPAFYYEGENYFIYVLYYSNQTPSFHGINSKDDLDALLNFKDDSYVVKRIARIYKEKGSLIILIKPKQIRFWMQSIALRDADSTFNDIINTWYNE